jgi:LemA protein
MENFAYLGLGFFVILAIVIVLVASIYNKLVTARNRFQNAFSQIDVQLKRRYDLIPNLVETAKGYLAHEKETLEAVISARNGAVSAAKKAANSPGEAGAMAGLAGAESMLGGALGNFFALSEAYPDLKADTTMNNLHEELTSTENKIAFSRQAFNDSATTYNTLVEKVPNNVVAGTFNFTRAALLEFEGEEIQVAPKVSFS